MSDPANEGGGPVYYDPDGYLVATRCVRDDDPFQVLLIDVDYR